jgi:hypothetical protein
MVAFTASTCMAGDLDESSKSRVQVARKAAKDFLAFNSALSEIVTKDLDDAMARVSVISQRQ